MNLTRPERERPGRIYYDLKGEKVLESSRQMAAGSRQFKAFLITNPAIVINSARVAEPTASYHLPTAYCLTIHPPPVTSSPR